MSFSSTAQLTANFTADTQAGCAGLLTVNFTNTSTGSPTTYSWNFGDGATSNQNNPSHTYSVAGVYTVTLTISSGATSDTEIKNAFITVYANPVASMDIIPDTVCSGESVTLEDVSAIGGGAITSCLWAFNDGSLPQNSCPSVTHIYTNSTNTIRTYTPNLLVTDVNGCNSSINGTVYVLPRPVANFSFTGNNSCTAPATISFNNLSQNTGLFSWDFGDPTSGAANFSSLEDPSHTYQNAGIYTVILTAGLPGCSSSDTQTVALSNPLAAFTASDTVICQNDTVYFNNTGTSGNYNWDFGDPISGGANSSTLPDPLHVFSTPGTYTTTMTVSTGGCSSSTNLQIRVLRLPSVAITAPDRLACDTPFTVNFSDNFAAGHVSWSWAFGDPNSGSLNTSTNATPSHTYTAFGDYTITLSVVDTNGCSNSQSFFNWVRIVAPSIGFNLTDSGCVNDTFNFSAQVFSPGDPIISNYQWNFGDGTGAQNVNTPFTTHSYTAAGIYDVTLSIETSTGCRDTLTQPAFIRIGNKPTANFSASPILICFQDTVDFTDLTPNPPDITAWQWSFGDGGSAIVQNPSYVYNIDTSGTADPFDVTLIVFSNGCPDTLVIEDLITVQGPKPEFSPIYNCTNPLSVEFFNTTGGATDYSWDFGDGGSSTLATPTHVYANRGDFTVILTASNSLNGCEVTKERIINVRIADANITASPLSGCAPLTTQFSGTTSQDANTYRWTFGDPASGSADTALPSVTQHVYNMPGNYTATLEIRDIHGCTNIETAPITVNGPTAAFIGGPLTGCPPLYVNFSDTSDAFGGSITQWSWNYGNGNTSTSTTTGAGAATYTAAGNYSVTLTVTDANGCTDSQTSFNYIQPTQPAAVISSQPADTVACRNELLNFFVYPGPYVANPVSYAWDFGDGTTSTTAPTSHSYSANGNYQVRVIATDANGCADTAVSPIMVYTTPAQFSIQSVDTCVELNGIRRAQVYVSINSDSNNYVTNWNWDLELTSIPQGNASVFYAYAVPPDTYYVSLIVTNQFGCRDTAFDPGAVIVPGPSGSFDFVPDSGCRPLEVNFYGTSNNAAIYSWDFGDGTVLAGTTDDTLSHLYTANGLFIPRFYLGFQLNGSTSYCYVPADTAGTVEVTSLLSVDIVQDVISVRDEEYDTLNVVVNDPSGSSPYTYLWNPSDRVYAEGPAGQFLATTTGDSAYYYVTVPYGNGCSVLDSVLVLYIPCEFSMDSIPNVFTPNSDGKNDEYYIDDLCNSDRFKFIIFNRWGRIIYESEDPKFKWDGTTKSGEEASDGVYYYTLQSRSKEYHGWIQLIRDQK
jgi:gliding motility-associated-like protein